MQTGITLSDVILSLTFFALLWYTWETRGMHKEIVDQTRLQLTPFVVIALENDALMAVNHGESTATNIEFRCSIAHEGTSTNTIIHRCPFEGRKEKFRNEVYRWKWVHIVSLNRL